MTQLLFWLRRPYPFRDEPQRFWTDAFIGFLFVTFFLFIFKPFGTTLPPGGQWVWFSICCQFGLVTFVVGAASGYCLRFFPRVFAEEKWTVGREILLTLGYIGLIGLGNMLFMAFRFDNEVSVANFFYWQWMTLLVGLFPVAFGVFAQQWQLMKRYAAQADALSSKMAERPTAHSIQTEKTSVASPIAPASITLSGENQGENLLLAPEDLYYISAADNYVQVFFAENGQLKNRLLRGTLKKMEELLADCPQMFRCHRTFLVNLAHVERVSGNAQGYKLHLRGVEATVPVSRALNGEVSRRIG